jgi:hypothetical protein
MSAIKLPRCFSAGKGCNYSIIAGKTYIMLFIPQRRAQKAIQGLLAFPLSVSMKYATNMNAALRINWSRISSNSITGLKNIDTALGFDEAAKEDEQHIAWNADSGMFRH